MSENDQSPVEIPPRGKFLSNNMYDTLKWIAQIFLPAVGGLYFGLSDLWNLPKALEVVGTIALVDTFLGLLLGLSARQFNDDPRRLAGVIRIDTVNPSKDVFSLELNEHVGVFDLANKDEVTFKIKNAPGAPPYHESDLPGNDG